MYSSQFGGFLRANDKSERTITTYLGELQKFTAWVAKQGLLDLLEVTPIDIQEYRGWLQDLNRKPATINKALVVLKSFYRWCVEQKLLVANPADRVKLVEQQEQVPKWLERSEQLRLKRAILQEKSEFKRLRDMAAVLLMMGVGLRVDEVVSLALDDVSIGERRGKAIVRKGKRGKYREVPLNAETRKAIHDYMVIRGNNKYAADTNLLFVGQRGALVTRALQHTVEKYGERAKIAGLTAHRLRHTFCHELVKAGERLDVIARLAGHKSINTTALYIMPNERDLQDAVERISWE